MRRVSPGPAVDRRDITSGLGKGRMRPRRGLVLVTLLMLVATLRSADARPVIAVGDTAMAEGDTGLSPMAFRVRLRPPAATPVSFHYETLDGTATVADGDYIPIAGDTTFAPGQDQVVLVVPIRGDSLLEANERFTLHVFAVTGADPAERYAVGTILNDEHTRFARFTTGVPDFGPGTLPPDWGDADGDGRPDLPLYQNLGGVFDEMPGWRALLGDGNYHGGAWCDYDRDGRMDYVLMPYGDDESSYNFTRLLHNTPLGFLDVGSAVGVDVTGHGETPVWADFDGDGWPDLFLPFYSHVFPYRSFFYRNLHDGSFKECADSAGVSLPGLPIELRPEGAAAADWNGDGAIDLYCASHLFLNDGTAHFTDIREQVGLPIVFDEGAQFLDYDDDGDLDLYMRTATGPTLFRNENGTFTDVSATLGIGFVDWLWGDRWFDADLDGDLDLLFFDPVLGARLLINNGDGTFTEDLAFRTLGLQGSLSAFADMDGDGDLDMVVGEYSKQFARNLLEEIPRAHTPYLKVRLEDAEGRLVEQGATVRLRSLDDPKHPVQTRIVDGGSGYLGQDEYTLTFGGVGSGSFDLEVSFPAAPGTSGIVGPAQNPLLGGLRPGLNGPQLVVVRRNGMVFLQNIPAPVAAVVPGPSYVGLLSAPSPNPVRTATRMRFSLPAPARVTLTVHDLSGRRIRTLSDGPRAAGPGDVTWDLRDDAGRPVPTGLYFARLVRDGRPAGAQRVVVVR